MTITRAAVNFILHIAEARLPDGVPVPYAKRWSTVAQQMEQAGLVERHYVGERHGACLTARGRELLDALCKLSS